MKKKTLKATLCYLSALAMLASGAVPISASELTAEELYDKYGDYYGVSFSETGYASKMERFQKLQDSGWTTEELIELGFIKSVEEATKSYLNAGWHYDTVTRKQTPTLTFVNNDGVPYDGYPQTEEEWENLDILSSIHHVNAYISYIGHSADNVIANCECADGFYYAEYEPGKATIAGVNLQWLKETQPSKLVIPKEIGGLTVTRIQQGACRELYRFVENLEEIVVPDTVEEIQSGAFSKAFGSEFLSKGKINIPKNVKVIGDFAYQNCAYSISSNGRVVLPESIEYVDTSAFHQIDSVVRVRLPETGTLVTKREQTFNSETEKVIVTGGVTLEDAYHYQRARVEAGERITCLTWYSEDGYTHIDDSEKFTELHPQFYQTAAAQPHPATVQAGTGDLNEDGETTIADAILLSRYVAEDETLSVTEAGIAQADINASGTVDAGDIAALLKQIAGL